MDRERRDTPGVCEDAERLARLRAHAVSTRFRCGTGILYAGITRRDLNPRGCPLRNSARIFPVLIVPRPYVVVVVVVVLNCEYSYSSDRVIYSHRTRSTSCTRGPSMIVPRTIQAELLPIA